MEAAIPDNARYYVSFDCGNVALGYAVFAACEFQPDNAGNIDCTTAPMWLIAEGVIDVLAGRRLRDTDAIWRARQLHAALTSLEPVVTTLPADRTSVLVEYQMGPNVKSHSVFDGIVMYYVARYNVHTVGPSLKNCIQFCADGQIANFRARYARSYDANKAQTAFNFEYLLRTTNRPSTTAKKYMKDVADAFMGGLAWHCRRSKTT